LATPSREEALKKPIQAPKNEQGWVKSARLILEPFAFYQTLLAGASHMASELIQCVYASAAARDFKTQELAELLKVARENNAKLGLTGMLLYAEGSFFQVLEGQADVVDALYAKIERDPRHDQMTLIIKEPIPKRHFDEWTMGFYKVSRAELAGMSGVNDFFGRDRTGVDAGRAKKLLAHGRHQAVFVFQR
jgi:Sensors of blue-light using FAD